MTVTDTECLHSSWDQDKDDKRISYRPCTSQRAHLYFFVHWISLFLRPPESSPAISCSKRIRSWAACWSTKIKRFPSKNVPQQTRNRQLCTRQLHGSGRITTSQRPHLEDKYQFVSQKQSEEEAVLAEHKVTTEQKFSGPKWWLN